MRFDHEPLKLCRIWRYQDVSSSRNTTGAEPSTRTGPMASSDSPHEHVRPPPDSSGACHSCVRYRTRSSR